LYGIEYKPANYFMNNVAVKTNMLAMTR